MYSSVIGYIESFYVVSDQVVEIVVSPQRYQDESVTRFATDEQKLNSQKWQAQGSMAAEILEKIQKGIKVFVSGNANIIQNHLIR